MCVCVCVCARARAHALVCEILVLNHLKVSYIIMALCPEILVCFLKNRGIFLHNPQYHCQLHNFTLIILFIQSTLHVPVLSVDLIMPFIAFPHLVQNRIQSRSHITFSCRDSIAFFNLKCFPPRFFIFYDINVLKKKSFIYNRKFLILCPVFPCG